MRLFIDIETLVLWDGETKYDLNQPLIEAIKQSLRVEAEALILWSDKGKNYSRGWGRTIFPDIGHVPADKQNFLNFAIKDDIVVDNKEIKLNGVKSLTPDKFIKHVELLNSEASLKNKKKDDEVVLTNE